MIGQLLAGRYLILESLGTGGFSETYLARDKYLPHYPLCVVKRLQIPPDSPISAAAAREMFEREAKILRRLGQSHEQIPTLLAYCEDPEQVYLVQEYIEGENLASWLSAGHRLTAAAAIALLSDLLPVLDYIHRCNIIHHDIKPSNLIYRQRDSKLVLIDFGAAGLGPELTTGAAALTIGTPGYMPDEQDQGRSQFNSDLYALGMLVIYLLTGVDPRQFQPDPITGELDWQRYLPDPSIAPHLLKILDRMVRIAWRDRYAQATDVSADLNALAVTPMTLAPKMMKQRWQPAMQQFWRRGWMVARWALGVAVLSSGYLLTNQEQAQTLWARWQLLADRSDVQLHKRYEIPVTAPLDHMMIAPNDQWLVTAAADQIQLWALNSGSRYQTLAGSTGKVTAFGMSRDSQLLVSGSQDGTVRLWRLGSGQLWRTFKGHQKAVSTVAISADARMVASGSQDGTVRLWRVATGTLERTLTIPNAAITAVAYGAPDRVISASSARADPGLGQIQVWHEATGKLEQTLTGHTAAIMGLQADASRLMSVGQDRALLWNLSRKELAAVFPKDSGRSLAAVWHHQQLVTVHDNGSIRAWIDKTGGPLFKQVGKVSPSLAVALSANQQYVVGWGVDQRLRVWQMNPTQMANF